MLNTGFTNKKGTLSARNNELLNISAKKDELYLGKEVPAPPLNVDVTIVDDSNPLFSGLDLNETDQREAISHRVTN